MTKPVQNQSELAPAPLCLQLPNRNAPLIVSFGGGVDSTAMLVAMKRAGIVPGLILFADTGGEKPETYAHVRRIDSWLESWGAPRVTWVRYNTLTSTPYDDLAGNCTANETLPSLAFGGHSCSIKWKIQPQDYYVQGCRSGTNYQPGWPPALEAWEAGVDPIRAIGYDAGPADRRRAGKVHGKVHDKRLRNYSFWYPLQDLDWKRGDCIAAIVEEGLPVPIKSACFFCPASKAWELWWLAGIHPDLFIEACQMEYQAFTGRHNRWEAEKGMWTEHLTSGQPFPAKSHCGLGRTFSWCKFAHDNKLVDLADWRFIGDLGHCLDVADELRGAGDDNARDSRATGPSRDCDSLRYVSYHPVEASRM